MLGRVATYVIPALSVALTAAVLLGPGSTRKAAFARVYGAPWEGTSALSLRIEVAERWYGIDEKAQFHDVTVEAVDDHNAFTPLEVSLDASGIGEAYIPSKDPIRDNVMVRVRRDNQVLAVGQLELYPAAKSSGSTIAPLRLPGQTTGNIKINVDARRGAMAAPFSEAVDIQVGLAEHVSPSNRGFKDIALEASAPGAEIDTPKFVTDENGRASIKITPQAHHIELTITAKDEAHGDGKWVGTLPVIPGAIWLEAKTRRLLKFVSPVPRERAYVSLMNEKGRIFGAIIPVSLDELGSYRGTTLLPDLIDEEATHVIVAGDPQEQGSGTVAWPLQSRAVEASQRRFVRLVDGAKAAEERERQRAYRARNVALLVVIATTVFEVLFMIAKSRQSQKRFEKNLMGFVEGEPGSTDGAPSSNILATARAEHPVLRVALAVSLVLVAFSMIGALSTLQY